MEDKTSCSQVLNPPHSCSIPGQSQKDLIHALKDVFPPSALGLSTDQKRRYQFLQLSLWIKTAVLTSALTVFCGKGEGHVLSCYSMDKGRYATNGLFFLIFNNMAFLLWLRHHKPIYATHRWHICLHSSDVILVCWIQNIGCLLLTKLSKYVFQIIKSGFKQSFTLKRTWAKYSDTWHPHLQEIMF